MVPTSPRSTASGFRRTRVRSDMPGEATAGPTRATWPGPLPHGSLGPGTSHSGVLGAGPTEIPPGTRDGGDPAQISLREELLEGGAGRAGDVEGAGGEDGVVAVGAAHGE